MLDHLVVVILEDQPVLTLVVVVVEQIIQVLGVELVDQE